MKKQKAKKHRPSYALDLDHEHFHHRPRPSSSSSSPSSSPSHQPSVLKTLVTKLTRELPLTTQSRKALSFPLLLESLSQHLASPLFVANVVKAVTDNDNDNNDLESLRQVHTLLLLALSYHVQRFHHHHHHHNSTHNQQSTAPLSWLASMIQVLGQLYHLQLQQLRVQQQQQQHRQMHPVGVVTQAECQESLAILLRTLMRWSVLVLVSSQCTNTTTTTDTPNQHPRKEEVEILMGLVELTNMLLSCLDNDHRHLHNNNNVQPRLSGWFQYEYCPRVLEKLVSSHWLLSQHEKSQIQKIQVCLQELRKRSNRNNDTGEIIEVKLGWCEPVQNTSNSRRPNEDFCSNEEESALVTATSNSAVMMNLPMNIVKLLLNTIDHDNQALFHTTGTALTANQVKQCISTLVRRILQPEYEHDDCPVADWEASRREALQSLLSLLEFFLLSEDNTWSMIIPAADWVAIIKSLLQSCSDDQVVHDTTRMLCRLLPHRLTATVTTIFHQHVSLLSALAMVLAHPFTHTHVKSEVLHILFRLTYGDDDHEYQLHHALFLSQMARAPMVLQAVSHVLATSSTTYSSQQQRQDRHCAMSILMALSRPVSNHRIVAQQSGVLSSMIRFVRHYEESDDNNSQSYLGQALRGGREALKERILQVAEAL